MRDFYLFHEMSVAEAIVRRLWRWAVPLLLSLLLAGIALQNYLLFHTLVELFTIVVAVSAAVIVWNTYPFTRNGFLLYLGLGHLGLAWLTLLHTLSYKGMGLFEIGDANLPTQFWVAIRFSECLLWLSAPLFLGHGARPRQGLLLFGLWVLILNGLIYTGIFPDAFLEASGLTAFKKISEIAVIGLLALAAGFLLGNRARLDPAMLSLLLGSLGLSALAGVAFMLYRDVYGIANMVGHLLRLCAYGLIYQALVEFVVKRPFQNLAQGASTYDAVPDAIVLVDRLGLIRDANQAARQLFRGGDGIGNAVHALLHPSIQGPCAVCDAIRAGESLSAFAFAHPVQGVYFEISLSPIRRADEAVAMIQISRDITGRRRADALLETSRSRLEASHHRLEATVSELQLMATRAESANIAKSEFLANMSHEIRTPLNGVIGMNELLLNSPLSPEQRRYAEVVSTSGRALLGLINDILDFSRIEARRLDFENVSFDLAELIEQTVSILAVPAHDKGLSLITCLDPAVPARVCGDPARLRQVLTNLLGNSVKFTPAGEVRLSVACEQADPAQVRLHFAVRDTGIGIAAGQIEKIFKPFTQADGSTTRKYGGTGLGLSIAYQLVEMMGGELHCLSQPGSGSEFWFSIRFDRPQPEDEVAAPAPPESVDPRPPSRILLAEDHPVNQAVAEAMIIKLGHRVKLVSDGRDALAALRCEAFDLVLMDCQMPEMDGYEATRAIRRGEAGNPAVPVIALTAHALKGDREACLIAGMNDYLPKPFSLGQLAEVLASWLPGPNPEQSGEAVPALPQGAGSD